MTRIKFYLLIFVILLFAYGWLGWNMYFDTLHSHNHFSICLFKNVSGLPCPSCGSTRAILLLLEGKWYESVLMNPLGIPMLLALVLLPCWIVYDFLVTKNSMQSTFLKAETYLKRSYIAYPAIALLALLWSWKLFIR